MADAWLEISSTELDDSCEGLSQDLKDALDGLGRWYHYEVSDPHWFVIDLGQTYTIKKVRGRSKSVADPIDVDILISDSNPPTTLIEEGITTWQDTNDWVEIDITDSDGRYIKVHIEDTEAYIDNTIQFGDTSPTPSIFDAYGDVAAGGTAHEHAASDTLTIGDSVAYKMEFAKALADTLGISDAVAYKMAFGQSFTDTMSISDAVAYVATYYQTLADTLNITDSVAYKMAFKQSLADTMNIADSVEYKLYTQVAIADTLTIGDSVAYKMEFAQALADTLGISDAVAYKMAFKQSFVDTMSISDAVTYVLTTPMVTPTEDIKICR